MWTRLVADLETPVSAMLKLSDGQPMSCLLESVEGGAVRGRYSIIGIAPDIVWRAFGDRAEINRQPQSRSRRLRGRGRCRRCASLRALLAQLAHRAAAPSCRRSPPASSATWATTRCGWSSTCPTSSPTRWACPTACSCARRVMVVFDAVKDEMIVVTPVYPQPEVDAQAAYAAAVERLRGVVAALDEPLPHATSMSGIELALPDARLQHHAGRVRWRMVARAKEYIAAGDVFQVVLVAALLRALHAAPLRALPRARGAPTPRPSCSTSTSAPSRWSARRPEILVRVRDGEVTIRPLAGTRRRGATPEEDKALEAGAARRPQGARRAPDAARPRPQRRRPRRRDRHGARHRELRGRALQPRHAHRQPRRRQARRSGTTSSTR